MRAAERVGGVASVLAMQAVFFFGSLPFALAGMDAVSSIVLWDMIVCAGCFLWYSRKRDPGWTGRPLRYGRLTSLDGLGAGLAMLAGLAIASSIFLSMVLLRMEAMIPDDGMAARSEAIEAAGYVKYLVFSMTVAPVAEEAFYRVFTYGALRRCLSVVPAAILSSFLFAAGHMTMGHLASGTAFGLFLAMVYEYTGTWWASTFCHVVYNVSVTGVSMSEGLVSFAETPAGGLVGCAGGMAVVIVACAAVRRKEKEYGLYRIPGVPHGDEADHP